MSESQLRRMDSRPVGAARGEVRACLIVRNESLRLPALLDHHRQIGVDRFFIVDNASDDGTLDLLLAESDVHVFWTDAPFRTDKAHWRRAVMEEFFSEGWGLHVDADELFVYPHMEQIDLHRFCSFLDEEGVAGIFASMVDMYGQRPLDSDPYRAGDPLTEHYPFFDRGGYQLRFRGRRQRDRVSPPFQLVGGARARVFFAHRAGVISRALARRFYDVGHTTPHPATRIPGLGARLNSLARRALPAYLPSCGKVPLLRSDVGLASQTRCLEALHELEPAIPLSHCWASLLHFKYMPNLREHVTEASETNRYGTSAGAEYQRYAEVLRETDELVLYGPHSARFESTADLLESGLMRRTEELTAFSAKGS